MSLIINGLTNAHVPYKEVRSPLAIVPLNNAGCFVLFISPPSVISVVPVIMPRYPLKIVRGTIIVSFKSAEFLVFS